MHTRIALFSVFILLVFSVVSVGIFLGEPRDGVPLAFTHEVRVLEKSLPAVLNELILDEEDFVLISPYERWAEWEFVVSDEFGLYGNDMARTGGHGVAMVSIPDGVWSIDVWDAPLGYAPVEGGYYVITHDGGVNFFEHRVDDDRNGHWMPLAGPYSFTNGVGLLEIHRINESGSWMRVDSVRLRRSLVTSPSFPESFFELEDSLFSPVDVFLPEPLILETDEAESTSMPIQKIMRSHALARVVPPATPFILASDFLIHSLVSAVGFVTINILLLTA
jgi:hypothetical protein